MFFIRIQIVEYVPTVEIDVNRNYLMRLNLDSKYLDYLNLSWNIFIKYIIIIFSFFF